ncbi:MAG: hypothetical protein Q9198_000735, partial [Flavoplaca austrocitrina]
QATTGEFRDSSLQGLQYEEPETDLRFLTVWVYVVQDTVEQSVYDISVERRMRHVTGRSKYEEMESQIEAADTLELEGAMGKLLSNGHGGGEFVDQADLWFCLFRDGHGPSQMHKMVERRHLGATAAEGRQ